MRTFLYAIIHKVLELVPLTATGNEVYVDTITTVLSHSCYSLKETLTHLNCLKLKDRQGDNVAQLCAEILVNANRIESAEAFKTQRLGYITLIFQNTSDPRFHIRATQKYKDIKQFIKKLHICDKGSIQTEDFITYGYLGQEDMGEYHNIVTSKQWEPTDIKESLKMSIFL